MKCTELFEEGLAWIMQVRLDIISLVQGVEYFLYPAGEMNKAASTTTLKNS